MLNDVDLKKLTPYFSEGKVVSIDVKDRGKKGREVLLEYDDGRKMVGDLNANPFRMQPLTGMTSIASYFARGKYGSNAWRGNCSGLLIKDLLNHYQPDTFGDLAVGSGTSIEVANDLGYTSANTVFSDLNPKYGGIDISGDDLDFPLMDFIFSIRLTMFFLVRLCRYIPARAPMGRVCGVMKSILTTVPEFRTLSHLSSG